MSLSLSAEQKELIKIFKIEEQYIIPAYQRPYSWKYDHCLTLYNDVMDAYHENEDYFIGNIIIAKNNTDKYKLEVIDGQQRLTTILLFIKVLSIFSPETKVLFHCLEQEDWEMDKKDSRIKSEVFESEDGVELRSVLNFTKENFENLSNRCKDKKGNFSSSKCSNKFEENIMFFYNWINFYNSKNDDLKEFIKFILQRVYLLPIELGGSTADDARNKALKIFETLNNRGMSLNDADIFKSKLYNKAEKINETERFKEAWKDLRNSCELNGVTIDDIFRYYSHIIRGKEGKTTSEINLREFFTRLEYSPFNLKNYDEILDDLFYIVEAIEFIKEEKNQETELAKWLQLVEIYTNQYPKVALVVYLVINRDSINRDIVSFLKKLVRFVYFEGSTTTIKFEIYNIIRDICIHKEINDYIQDDISTNDFNYLGGLKYGYALLAFYLTRDKALNSFSIDKLITYKDEKTLTKLWTNVWSKERIAQIDNQLGNFVVLDIPKKNITIDKKRDYYSISNLNEVKNLSSNLFNFSYSDFQNRDNELKQVLVDFFQDKLL